MSWKLDEFLGDMSTEDKAVNCAEKETDTLEKYRQLGTTTEPWELLGKLWKILWKSKGLGRGRPQN